MFIVLVILETEKTLYEKHSEMFDGLSLVFATIITLEYFLSLWSVTANGGKFGSAVIGRLRWATDFFPIVDLVVIAAFWTTTVS
jgi:hypothetical protein